MNREAKTPRSTMLYIITKIAAEQQNKPLHFVTKNIVCLMDSLCWGRYKGGITGYEAKRIFKCPCIFETSQGVFPGAAFLCKSLSNLWPGPYPLPIVLPAGRDLQWM